METPCTCLPELGIVTAIGKTAEYFSLPSHHHITRNLSFDKDMQLPDTIGSGLEALYSPLSSMCEVDVSEPECMSYRAKYSSSLAIITSMAKIQGSDERFELHTISIPYNTPDAENGNYSIPENDLSTCWSIIKPQSLNLTPKKKHEP